MALAREGAVNVSEIVIAIEDDWELMGNGSGNVAQLQYLPALFLMNAAQERGIPVSFMVDVMQQIAFDRLQTDHPELRTPMAIWEEAVKTMILRGFDVQMHIHPQWDEARWDGKHFHLGTDWNLARYPDAVRRRIVTECSNYLRNLGEQIQPNYQLSCFKAGSWGLQPSQGLLDDLEREGIGLVVGLREGMVHPGVGVDYRGLEETYLAYRPDRNDIRRIAQDPESLWWLFHCSPTNRV